MWQAKSCCPQQYRKTAHGLNTQPFQRPSTKPQFFLKPLPLQE